MNLTELVRILYFSDSVTDKFGSNKKLKLLGEGLNSRVYRQLRRAREDLPTHEVALKVFKNIGEFQTFETRFQKLVKFRSRYCANYLGWELIHNQIAVVMDYVDGVRLSQLLSFLQDKPALVQEVMYQLQEALKELHHSEFVHGDLSLNNVMIDRDGRLKLIDFGLGQLHPDGALVGTPRFLSPERWGGEPVSVASDIFACGLLYMELVAPTCENINYYRRRSIQLSDKDGPWFHSQSDQRQFSEVIQESRDARRQLAITVAAFLDVSKASTLETMRLITEPIRNLSAWARFTAGIAAILLFHSPSTLGRAATGQQLDVPGEIEFGLLEVKTQNWYRLRLDGQDLGFTPLHQKPISAGFHKLQWVSQNSEGELTVVVKPRQKLIVRDGESSLQLCKGRGCRK